MRIPYWLLRLLPMWDYVCPACREEVPKNSHECPHCGEKYPLALKLPPFFLKDPKKLDEYVHKHVFPRISEFERNYLTQYFTTIFSSGWETGEVTDGGIWTKVNNPTVTTSPVHHGSYALQCDATRELVYKFISNNPCYLRFYLYRHSTPTANTIIAALYDNQYATDVRTYINTSNVLYLHAPSGDYSSGVTLSVDTWYCIEICRVIGSGNGLAKLWVDGTLKVDRTTETISGNSYEVNLGLCSYSGSFTGYFDCVVCADAYIGTEATLKTVTDSLGLSDSILRHKPLLPITDAVGATDAVKRNKTFAVADAIGVSDAAFRNKPSLTITDSLGLVDAILRNKTLTVADSVGASDAVRGSKNPLIVADVVSLEEAILRDKTLLISDSVGTVDAVRGDKSPLIVTDVVSLVEFVNVITAIVKTVTDAVGSADLALVNKTAVVADALSVLDQVFRHKPSVSVSDVVGVAEAVLVAKLLAVEDSVSLTDVLKVLKTLNVSDALSLADAPSTPSRVLQILDSVGLADNFTVNKVLQITENINLVETIQVGVGGVKKTKLFFILGDLAVQLTGD